ncbi:hypothetical protein [Acrocarpospora catenulata]|uniref:hypothetical protein n=1 Tax=Acrocarpospora catenulata TaxID=2836182 RepID=UPI001BDACC82|nr:hypothetical protein [Acrocarpospora catenulata]
MRPWTRAIVVCAVAWGAALGSAVAWAEEAPPETPDNSELSRLVGADLGSVVRMLPGVLCGYRLVSYNSPVTNSPVICVNGPIASGNSTHSGNYVSHGNPVNSGNFSNTNGSTGSANASNSGNAANGRQENRVKEIAR